LVIHTLTLEDAAAVTALRSAVECGLSECQMRLKEDRFKSAVRQRREIEHFLISDNKSMLGTYQPPSRVREVQQPYYWMSIFVLELYVNAG
jgi:hypothetical protein